MAAMNICRKIVACNSLVMGKNIATKAKESCERTTHRFCSSMPRNSNAFGMKEERAEFIKALPGIIDDLAKHQKFQELPEAEKWMRKVLNTNLAGGKYTRGFTTVLTYRMMENPENITEETLRLAHTLGWCTEILESYCVVLDDIADGSITRRGMPCWYLREDVGIGNAVNDATLIHYAMLQILRINFENSPNYLDFYHNLNESLFYASIGQYLDIMTGMNRKNYTLFTINQYNAIVKHKSAYYTYKLPITLGMLLANKYIGETQKNVDDISLQLGRLFQMQDDYIDCFGDENLTGKMGTDIQEGKCSWLAVNALQRCKASQRSVFNVCYGSKEPAHVERIKQLYVQLKIPQLYKDEEYEIYNNIVNKIKTIPSAKERALFTKILDGTYGRKH